MEKIKPIITQFYSPVRGFWIVARIEQIAEDNFNISFSRKGRQNQFFDERSRDTLADALTSVANYTAVWAVDEDNST